MPLQKTVLFKLDNSLKMEGSQLSKIAFTILKHFPKLKALLTLTRPTSVMGSYLKILPIETLNISGIFLYTSH